MSDEIQHIDVDDEQFDGTPRALRDYVNKLQKRNNELTSERDGFRNRLNENALGDVLTGFKNPERVKADILRDKVDPLNSEAVAKWLEGNADDYARATGDPAPVQDPATPAAHDRTPLDFPAQVGTPGNSDLSAVINSVPQDLSPEATRLWLIQHGA